MNNNLVDLRYFLLNFANNNNILLIQKILFGLSFLFFLIIYGVYFIQNHFLFIKQNKYLLSDNIFIISIILFTIVGRWSSLLLPEMNVDESQFIAAGMKLFKDPLFWKSVDTGSSGPLNIFPLTLPLLLGIRLEYASARIIAILLVLISVLSLYYSLNFIYNKLIARSAIFLVVITFAVMPIYDILYYSSEYMPMAILAMALLAICFSYRYPRQEIRIISGFLLGAIPFAKFQAVPIAFALALMSIHIIYRQSRNKIELSKSVILFGLSLTVFSLITLTYLLKFSLFDDFWKSYIQENLLNYSSGVFKISNEISTIKHSEKTSLFNIYLGYVFNLFFSTRVLFCLAGSMLFVLTPILAFFQYFKIQDRQRSQSFYLVYYSVLQLLLSLYSVLKPGNYFDHYLIFLVIPCGFFIGVCLGELQKITINFSFKDSFGNFPVKLLFNFLIYIFLVGIAQGLFFIRYDNPNLLKQKELLTQYHSPLEKVIAQYVSPGETMVVWGWAPKLYVATGTIQGVRDSVTGGQIISTPLKGYYIKRFIDDLNNSSPGIFVDAVSPNMFYFHDTQTQGHESSPELNRIINEKYKLVDSLDGVRIYKKCDGDCQRQ